MLDRLLLPIRRLAAYASVQALAPSDEGGPGPIATVVITTRNQATYLNLTLAALEVQILPPGKWEVIVIDNASSDATNEVLERFKNRNRLQLRTLRCDSPSGRATARNVAIEASRGTVVIFLEPEQMPAPDCVVWHLIHHVSGSVAVLGDDSLFVITHLVCSNEMAVAGIALQPLLTPADVAVSSRLAPLTVKDESSIRGLLGWFSSINRQPPNGWVYVRAGNYSLRRERLLSLGGFDEAFRGSGFDEDDLGYRLMQANVPFHYEPLARAFRQLGPRRTSAAAGLRANINHFLCKHAQLSRQERWLVRNGLSSHED